MILSTRCDGTRARRGKAPLHHAIGAASAAASILLASSASLAEPAEPTERDRAAAEALFAEARALVKAGNDAAGCPKFEASLALSPSASTMLNIAQCREREGKIATAWEDYHHALALNRQTQETGRRATLDDIARQGITALEARLPRLRVVIAHPPPGLRVTRDGKELLAAALGAALPADPGPHEVRVSAPGHHAETHTVTVQEGETATIEISLEAQVAARPRVTARAPKPPEEADSGAPAWVWVIGGAGLALTGASIYFLVEDLSTISELRSRCRADANGTFCEPGYDYQAANTRKDRSFALFLGLGGAGVVAIGAAVTGLVLAPSSRGPASPAAALWASPWVAPESAGAVIWGRF